MLSFFKQLFCKHQYSFYRVTYGDENNYSLPNRKVEKCSICNSTRYAEMTDEDWLKEKIKSDMRKSLGLEK